MPHSVLMEEQIELFSLFFLDEIPDNNHGALRGEDKNEDDEREISDAGDTRHDEFKEHDEET